MNLNSLLLKNSSKTHKARKTSCTVLWDLFDLFLGNIGHHVLTKKTQAEFHKSGWERSPTKQSFWIAFSEAFILVEKFQFHEESEQKKTCKLSTANSYLDVSPVRSVPIKGTNALMKWFAMSTTLENVHRWPSAVKNNYSSSQLPSAFYKLSKSVLHISVSKERGQLSHGLRRSQILEE